MMRVHKTEFYYRYTFNTICLSIDDLLIKYTGKYGKLQHTNESLQRAYVNTFLSYDLVPCFMSYINY